MHGTRPSSAMTGWQRQRSKRSLRVWPLLGSIPNRAVRFAITLLKLRLVRPAARVSTAEVARNQTWLSVRLQFGDECSGHCFLFREAALMQKRGRFFGGQPCARAIAARGAHLRFSECCSGQIILSADFLQDLNPFHHTRAGFVATSRVCRQGFAYRAFSQTLADDAAGALRQDQRFFRAAQSRHRIAIVQDELSFDRPEPLGKKYLPAESLGYFVRPLPVMSRSEERRVGKE